MWLRPLLVALGFSGLLTWGCGGDDCPSGASLWGDIRLEAYQPIPEIHDLDGGDVVAAQGVDGWELREVDRWDGGYVVVARGGEPCDGATDPTACEAAFEAVSPPLDRSRTGPYPGFGLGCFGDCVYEVAVSAGDETYAVRTAESLADVLGVVDTPTEAVLLVFALSYEWDDETLRDGSVRSVEGGFELLVMETTSLCDPVTTDRIQLYVDADGSFEERRRQLRSAVCGWCV